MGCDIHLYVERKTDPGWEHIPNHSDDWYDPANWYDGRDYHLFAILADVRNGYGFAGIQTTEERFNPIVPPRGLPADVSEPVRASNIEWGSDGHSHSWLTVNEVLAFDWDQTVTLTGLFHDEGREWLSGAPDPRYADGGFAAAVQEFTDKYHELPQWGNRYCSGVSGEGAEKYRRVTWRTPYHRAVSGDWWATVMRAYRISKSQPDDVRFVFWFDN